MYCVANNTWHRLSHGPCFQREKNMTPTFLPSSPELKTHPHPSQLLPVLSPPSPLDPNVALSTVSLISVMTGADLPTVPGFPGLCRKLSFCPGVPETYRMSRDRLPTGFVSRHPFRYMISILETLQRWASEGSDTRYCAICRIFN